MPFRPLASRFTPAPPMSLPRLLAALVVLAPAAHAQLQTGATPAAGTLTLRAGATELLDLTLRGTAESGVPDCYGTFEPSAPDAAVEWAGGALRLTVRSSTDVTLAVADPQGTWHCNDDAEGLMPVVELPNAARGRYAVWVGTFAAPGGAATLIAGAPAGPVALAPTGTAQVTTSLQSGFGATQRWSVRAGGLDAVPSEQWESYCSGFVDAARPTARVAYGGGGRLTAYVATEESDPILVVRTPDGQWICDDDSGEGLNSAVSFGDAPAGEYTVWAGTFRGLARAEAPAAEVWFDENEIVEESFDMGDFDMDSPPPVPYSAGSYQPLDLDARPRTQLALRSDDAVSAAVTVRPGGQNPVVGDACRGLIEPSATATVTLAGDGPVGITATADRDLVLLVRTPGGAWFCSDDADGLNPGVQIDAVERGAYHVWVGTFGFVAPDMQTEEISATLSVARGEITVSGGSFDGGGLGMGDAYAEGVYSGQELQAGRAYQTVGAGDEATVRAGGVLLNPVQGPTCAGFVDARPSAAVEAAAGVSFMASTLADDDLVMVVRTPDDRWLCSDDSNGTTDPMVRVDEGPEGTYDVWVGTFSRRTDGAEARLLVTP